MKIKSILVAAALLASTSVFAESYVTNGAGSNWFVGAGAGVNTVANGVFSGSSEAGHTFGVDFNFGKWITPTVGVRFDYNGFNSYIADQTNGTNAFGVSFLWDVTNQFGGYKENRVISVVPYLQSAYVLGINKGVAFGAGINFPVRLCKNFYLVPDVHAMVVKDNAIVPNVTENGNALFGSTTLGLQYRFGKSTAFQTAEAFVAPYVLAAAEAEAALQEANAKIQALEGQNADAANKNAKLASDNAALSNELATTAATNAAIAENLMKTTAYVYFEIGQATLSVKELAHFDYIVKTKIAQGKNLTFTIAGNADKNTGTKWFNQQLSKQRANYIVKLLTTKYGLSKDQFVVKANGGNNYTKVIQLNRAVIIDAQ